MPPLTAAPAEPLAAWARETLGHTFADLSLLERALTHSTTLRPSYQRLEFLGDRVLGFIVAQWLYRDDDGPEGQLTARLHGLVEGVACAEVARGWDASAYIRMERSAVQKGLGRSENVLGDVAEAVVAAVYLDAGIDAAEAFVRRHWGALVAQGPRFLDDPKTKLQNWVLKRSRKVPEYAVVDRSGADHQPRFIVEVRVHGQEPATGAGSNKREAEKAAAQAMLERIAS